MGESPNCMGVNMGGVPGWVDLSILIFPSQTIHNMFTPSCVGYGGGNFGPGQNGKHVTSEVAAQSLLP